MERGLDASVPTMNFVLVSEGRFLLQSNKVMRFHYKGAYRGIKIEEIVVNLNGFQLSPFVVYLLFLKKVKIDGKVLVANLKKYKPLSEVNF